MDEKLFQTLLYYSEGPELDFKLAQYVFVGADDINKSKLLKDILTFANSWRCGDAHILIGVEELSGGRRNPCGIPFSHHIDDAALQQFINSKTNRPVKFTYEAFSYDGKSFGVLTIPLQKRPIYAKKNFGIVKAGIVYFRRGSSCAEANPEEIYQMGLDDNAVGQIGPAIALELATLKQREVIGTSTHFKTIFHQPHKTSDFPDLEEKEWSLTELTSRSLYNQKNRDFYRELATYARVHRAYRPLGFFAKNLSSSLAQNVHIEMEFQKSDGLDFIEEDEMPHYPLPEKSVMGEMIRKIRTQDTWLITPVVQNYTTNLRLVIKYGDIKPKETRWADKYVYVAAKETGVYQLKALIYGDNIGTPQEVKIDLHFEVEQRPALKLAEVKSQVQSAPSFRGQ